MTPTPMLGIGTWVRILPNRWSMTSGWAGRLGTIEGSHLLAMQDQDLLYLVLLQGSTWSDDWTIACSAGTLMEVETWR